jgi:ATP-dependent RNA helicase DDX24/MAK5
MVTSDHFPKKASKRRLQEKGSSRKKAKVRHHTADDLPWKAVTRPQEAGLDGDDGILELEEVDGVEVVYEDTEGGRVARFNVFSFRFSYFAWLISIRFL